MWTALQSVVMLLQNRHETTYTPHTPQHTISTGTSAAACTRALHWVKTPPWTCWVGRAPGAVDSCWCSTRCSLACRCCRLPLVWQWPVARTRRLRCSRVFWCVADTWWCRRRPSPPAGFGASRERPVGQPHPVYRGCLHCLHGRAEFPQHDHHNCGQAQRGQEAGGARQVDQTQLECLPFEQKCCECHRPFVATTISAHTSFVRHRIATFCVSAC